MFRKRTARKGSSVIAALIVLCAVLIYAFAEWGGVMPAPEHASAAPALPRYDGPVERVTMPAAGAPVRLMTMNACNYFVPDDVQRSNFTVKFKPIEAREALADLVAQAKADILGLSEMGGEKAVEDLQRRLKRRGIDLPYCVMVMRKGEDRGLALLSKYPIEANNSVENMPLNASGDERAGMMLRGILDVTVKVPDGRMFRLMGVHLKSRVRRSSNADTDEVRRKEAYAVRDYLNGVMNAQEGMPLLLYGDFNDGPGNHSVKIIGGAYGTPQYMTRLKPKDSRGETWTFYYDDDDIYYVFDLIMVNDLLKKRLGRKSQRVILDSPAAKKAGDHRGIWLELM